MGLDRSDSLGGIMKVLTKVLAALCALSIASFIAASYVTQFFSFSQKGARGLVRQVTPALKAINLKEQASK